MTAVTLNHDECVDKLARAIMSYRLMSPFSIEDDFDKVVAEASKTLKDAGYNEKEVLTMIARAMPKLFKNIIKELTDIDVKITRVKN